MGLLGFSHVGVCCSDLERSTRFYVDALGFREVFTMELGPEVAPTMEVDGRFHSRMLARDELRLELLCWIEPEADGARVSIRNTGPGPRFMGWFVRRSVAAPAADST